MQQRHAQAQYSPRQLLESARRAEADGNVDLAMHIARYVLEHFPGSPESAEAYNSLLRLGQPPPDQRYAASMAPAPLMLTTHAGAASSPQQALQSHPATPQAFIHRPATPYAAQGSPLALASGAGNGYANGHQAAGYAPAARPFAPAPATPSRAGVPPGQQSAVHTIAATFAPAAPYRGAETKSPAMIHHAPETTARYRGGRLIARLTYAAGGLMMVAGVISPLPPLLGWVAAAPGLLGIAIVAGALIAAGILVLLGSQTALAVFDQADNMRELVELERTRWDG